MEMSKRAATGLNDSIKKWQKIVGQFEAGVLFGNIRENGADDCPLCQLYHPSNNDRLLSTGCSVCPIKKDTGNNFCAGSPYDDWSGDGTGPEKYEEGSIEAAQAMLNYLIGLRHAK